MHVVFSITKTSITMIVPQFWLSPHTMPKKSGKKKVKAIEADLDMDIISRI